MAEIVIINASPRAPRSNSKIYAQIFTDNCSVDTLYSELNRNNAAKLAESAGNCSKLVFVFPLYADGIPVTLLNFLKYLTENPLRSKPVISVMVNCGFLEYFQNDVAIEQMKLFCENNGYRFGSALKIGSGEAIAKTPFKFMVVRKIKKFAKAVSENLSECFAVNMPLPKRIFLIAADSYWLDLGKRYGIGKEEMDTPETEGKDTDKNR